jgi:peptide/nickel transport system permease protein
MRIKLVIGGTITVLIFAMAMLGALLPDETAFSLNIAARSAYPNSTHPLGTDALGRDLLRRLLLGTEITTLTSLGSILVAFGVGVPLGLVSCVFPTWLGRPVVVVAHLLLVAPSQLLAPFWSSRVLMTLCSMSTLPGALLVVAGVTYWGPSRGSSMMTLGLYFAAAVAYTIYRLDRSANETDERSDAVARRARFFIALGLLATSLFTWVTVAVSELDFLGLGVQPPFPSWGTLAEWGRLGTTFPGGTIISGLCLTLTGLGAFLLGDELVRVSPRGRA